MLRKFAFSFMIRILKIWEVEAIDSGLIITKSGKDVFVVDNCGKTVEGMKALL